MVAKGPNLVGSLLLLLLSFMKDKKSLLTKLEP